jgi:hypothetical protein
MKNVRAVFMNKNAVIVIMVVGVTGYVRAFVAHQHSLIRPIRQTLGQDTSGETRPDN